MRARHGLAVGALPARAWCGCGCSCRAASRPGQHVASGRVARHRVFTTTWNLGNYSALTEYRAQFARSALYASSATVLVLALGHPVAYVIAFRGGRWRTLMLGLVVLPFFTTCLIRTISWQTIMADGDRSSRSCECCRCFRPADGFSARPSP